MSNTLRTLIQESIRVKLTENVFTSKQAKELGKYFDVTSNKNKEAQIEVDMGSGVDLIDIKIKNGKVETSSANMGKEKFNNVDEFIASLMDGI